jgi:cyclic beta-1,2-glucan synthetase
MDFVTRDRYRHAVEDLARGSGRTELEVARQALALAGGQPRRTDDLGYYLILARGDRGSRRRSATGSRCRQRLVPRVHGVGDLGYLWIDSHRHGISPGLADRAHERTRPEPRGSRPPGAPRGLPPSDAARPPSSIARSSRCSRHGRCHDWSCGRRPLRAEDARGGPDAAHEPGSDREQIERLGVHYLANADGELRFALLSDWTDASEEHAPSDDALLAAARRGIDELNRRHGVAGDGEARFYLFHRRRLWSESERARGWAGERKRGKLHELNRLLRGATDTSFMVDGRVPSFVRFVDHARCRHAATAGRGRAPGRHAGASAQSAAHRVAREGRGRRGLRHPPATDHPTLPAEREASLFRQVFSGPGGIDPYSAAVSDVYQDLFGEGSYTGKGIYDVDTFDARPGRAGAGERAAEPRSVRGALRASRAGD